LCAGLGGGCGSGALPALANLAKKHATLVIAIATCPFTFEGKRRTSQADEAARATRRHADAVLLFDNDRMADLTEPLAGVHETFSASDQVITDTIAAVLRLTRSRGPLPLSLSDLTALFRTGSASCAFGTGLATGRNRVHEAVEATLKNPMLDRGTTFSDARTALIRIEGPADLRFVEVQTAAQSISRKFSDDCILQLAVDLLDDDSVPLTISVLSTAGTRPAPAPKPAPPESQVEPDPESIPVPGVDVSTDDLTTAAPSGNPDELFDTDPYTVPKASTGKKSPKPKQETLSLDPVNRGRFDKSEPTIVGGEDLDVPTFIRQKTRLS
ncbi:MAG: hypothetical protein WA771_13650, partial [Chthoniobacterales bacterium]